MTFGSNTMRFSSMLLLRHSARRKAATQQLEGEEEDTLMRIVPPSSSSTSSPLAACDNLMTTKGYNLQLVEDPKEELLLDDLEKAVEQQDPILLDEEDAYSHSMSTLSSLSLSTVESSLPSILSPPSRVEDEWRDDEHVKDVSADTEDEEENRQEADGRVRTNWKEDAGPFWKRAVRRQESQFVQSNKNESAVEYTEESRQESTPVARDDGVAFWRRSTRRLKSLSAQLSESKLTTALDKNDDASASLLEFETEHSSFDLSMIAVNHEWSSQFPDKEHQETDPSNGPVDLDDPVWMLEPDEDEVPTLEAPPTRFMKQQKPPQRPLPRSKRNSIVRKKKRGLRRPPPILATVMEIPSSEEDAVSQASQATQSVTGGALV